MSGENSTRYFSDYRPQVHDSDGLLFEASAGDWLWRPLVNPVKAHRISRFPAAEGKKFGLMQRDRHFGDYDDLGNRFERRPVYWIEEGERWGAGAIELVEIPTTTDYNDNIVAYWTPRDLPLPGQELHLTYRVSASLNGPEEGPMLQVHSTRLRPANGDVPTRFVIDFAGTAPQPADLSAPGSARIQVSPGRAQNIVVQTNDASGGWQVFFDLAGEEGKRTELRLRLQADNQPESETWIYDYQKSN